MKLAAARFIWDQKMGWRILAGGLAGKVAASGV